MRLPDPFCANHWSQRAVLSAGNLPHYFFTGCTCRSLGWSLKRTYTRLFFHRSVAHDHPCTTKQGACAAFPAALFWVHSTGWNMSLDFVCFCPLAIFHSPGRVSLSGPQLGTSPHLMPAIAGTYDLQNTFGPSCSFLTAQCSCSLWFLLQVLNLCREEFFASRLCEAMEGGFFQTLDLPSPQFSFQTCLSRSWKTWLE